MTEELKSLIADYKETEWEKLLRTNLGDLHLKEIKPSLDFIKNTFDDLVYSDHLETIFVHDNILQNLLFEFKNIKDEIIDNKHLGQKQNIINNVVNFKETIVFRIQPLFNALEIQNRYTDSFVSDKDLKKILPKSVKKYMEGVKEDFKKELQKTNEDVQKVQNQQAEQTLTKETIKYGDFFKKEYESNRIYYWCILIALVGFSSITCWMAHRWFYLDQDWLSFAQGIEIKNSFEFIIKSNFIPRIFILSIMVLGIALLRKEYLALRHQYTLNKHRHNALSSHKEILSSIQGTENNSDKEISNAILLELTKSMFSHQETGFVKEQKDSSGNKVVEISKSIFNKT